MSTGTAGRRHIEMMGGRLVGAAASVFGGDLASGWELGRWACKVPWSLGRTASLIDQIVRCVYCFLIIAVSLSCVVFPTAIVPSLIPSSSSSCSVASVVAYIANLLVVYHAHLHKHTDALFVQHFPPYVHTCI